MAVHELQGIFRGEGRVTDQYLVERRPERIEVGAIVHDPVHPSGLLGRDVSESSFQAMRRARRSHLLRNARGDREVEELYPAALGLDQDAVGVQILVNDL